MLDASYGFQLKPAGVYDTELELFRPPPPPPLSPLPSLILSWAKHIDKHELP